jgi:DNA-binding response OmpR family regulator
MYDIKLDNKILKLIEAKPEISDRDIAFELSVAEELVTMRIENFRDTREKILIVNYGHSVYDSLKPLLEAENYSVVKAPGNSSVLETIKTESPDIVLLDTGLENIDGFEICRQLRDSYRYWWIPVVMLSERCEVTDKVKAFEAGADDYITPPFNSLELKARLGMILRRTRI